MKRLIVLSLLSLSIIMSGCFTKEKEIEIIKPAQYGTIAEYCGTSINYLPADFTYESSGYDIDGNYIVEGKFAKTIITDNGEMITDVCLKLTPESSDYIESKCILDIVDVHPNHKDNMFIQSIDKNYLYDKVQPYKSNEIPTKSIKDIKELIDLNLKEAIDSYGLSCTGYVVDKNKVLYRLIEQSTRKNITVVLTEEKEDIISNHGSLDAPKYYPKGFTIAKVIQ